MVINRYLYCLFIVVVTASACAISKKKGERDQQEEDARVFDSSDAATSQDAGDRGYAGDNNETASGGEGSNGSAIDGGAFGLPTIFCGNGTVEGSEICDDGNGDQRDGCTNQCEFSCNADADCDDLNKCNGVEICTNDHTCDDSDPNLEEGAECGEDSSCWRGVCVKNVCGDAKRDADELCDDGNLDPNDGCTPDCELSCEDDSDCARANECLADSVCRDDGRHGGLRVCVGGSRLEDRTECEIKDANVKAFCGDPDIAKDGWCIRGVCTCAGCGDGEVDGDEECDDGLFNGAGDSPNNCSRDCRVVMCGNGALEGDEECDDGNDRRMDGCDSECKVEFAHRFTRIDILKDVDVPDFCKHGGNRFADAFAEEVLVMGAVPLNILDVVSRQFSVHTAAYDSFYVLHILNSDDTSMKTTDDDITIGLYRSSPYDLSAEDALDLPVAIEADQLDGQTLLPAEHHRVPSIQAGGGRVLSRDPIAVEMVGVTGDVGLMHDFMMQLVFDMSTLSQPNTAPSSSRDSIKISETVRLPERSGPNPAGLFCGAIGPELFNQPVLNEEIPPNRGAGPWTVFRSPCCKNRGDQVGMPYRNCEYGESTDQCEFVSDLIRQGCTSCFRDSSFPDILSLGDPACDLMKTKPEACFTIINGIDYDVDSDGDGVADSWSALFGFETQRIRIYDVREK